MSSYIKLVDSHETPELDGDDRVLLTDGVAYVEFHLHTDSGKVTRNEFTLRVKNEFDEDEIAVVNSSTNEHLPVTIPRLEMATPAIFRVGFIFRVSDSELIDGKTLTLVIEDKSGAEIDTQTLSFTEVVQ